MNPSSDDSRYKPLQLTDGKIVKIQMYFTFNLYIIYSELGENQSDKERFRELISKARIIKDYDEKDYRKLNEKDLEIIAAEILKNKGIYEKNNITVYDSLFSEMDKTLKEISENFTNTLNIIKDFSGVIAESIEPMQETIMAMSESLKPFTEKVNAITKSLQAVTSKWSTAINEFLEEHKDYLDKKEKASLIATKYDWFIAYDLYVTKDFYEELMELDILIPENKEVDDLFIKYYDSEMIEKIVIDLKDLEILGEFEEIFDQVILGYERKLFYLVVPALFILIEGTIAKGFNHEGRMNGQQLRQYIDFLSNNDEIESLQEVINKRMFIQFEHGNPIESPISRHAIMHGGDTKYGTKAVALRLFLIFCNISFSLFVNNNDDNG